MKLHRRTFLHAVGAASLAGAFAACGKSSGSSSGATIRVGYFPNITHSQALIGMARGDFAKELGAGVTIDAKTFNAGTSVIEAMFAGQLDLSYIGPNPAINGYIKSGGEALRIVAGATSGGAAFVVRPDSGILTAADLAGKTLASPQLGNTQDVALRAYLKANGLDTEENGGSVKLVPTENSQILDLFRQGQIDGAWVPEPWASRLIVDGGGSLYLDERDLWPNGDFVTAHVIVATSFLESHADLVQKWLTAHVAVTLWEAQNASEAKRLCNEAIKGITNASLSSAVMDGAWGRMRVTYDPISASLVKSAQSAYEAGFLDEEPDLDGIYSLDILNAVLKKQGLAEVS